jgi:aspartate/methionine/tyrosine aminotransferase
MHSASARLTVEHLVNSQIREVANIGMGNPDVLPFWFGEPDQVTPQFIRDRACAALQEGETFYTQSAGMPALRSAIAEYITKLHRPLNSERVVVTTSGNSALMIAAQTVIEPGSRVVVITPVWPNLTEIPKILGAEVVRSPLDCAGGRWTLNVDKLLSLLTPDTCALFINSPNNPTGWTMSRGEQEVVLAHCRKLGIWIVADDVYERLYFKEEGKTAPSFFAISHDEDKLLSTNSFSKSWSMTGWRLGWITAPQLVAPQLAKIVEYNTSCAPAFIQRAGIAAITEGEGDVQKLVTRLQMSRDYLCDGLNQLPGISAARPDGAMYLFFQCEQARREGSLSFAKRLVQEAGLGLAPGSAFGPEGEGFLRWCTASSLKNLEQGLIRMKSILSV